MKLVKRFRTRTQIPLAYFFMMIVVVLIIFHGTNFIIVRTEKLLRAGGYYFDNVDVVQIKYVSTKIYKVSHIEFLQKKQSVRIFATLEKGIKRQDEIALGVNQVQFLQKLKSSDVLQVQYSKTQKNEYVYGGLYLNGKTLEDVYYQRMPARWRISVDSSIVN